MKLYNGMAPNGLRVTIFLQEKGISLPTELVDIMGGGTQTADYLEINALGEVPVLELDDGRILTESVAICRYLEGLNPEPALFGVDLEEQAVVEMWNRRVELKIFNVLADIGRNEFELFKGRVEQFPDYAASQRQVLGERFAWLNDEMSDGRQFIAGEHFSIADITGMAALMVCAFSQIEIPAGLAYLKQWEVSIKQRSSWPDMAG